MKRLLLLFLLLGLSACYLAEPLPPDQDLWSYGQPANFGFDEEMLRLLDYEIENGAYGSIHSLIIIKDNHIIFENYYQNYYRNFPIPLDRASLITSSLALGLARNEGHLPQLDTPIHYFLPEYMSIFDRDPQKKEITLLDLMVHKAGFSWNENVVAYSSSLNDINRMKQTPDWTKYVLEQPMEAPPGLRHNYNSGTGLIISKIIETLSGEHMDTYLKARIFDPLKIESVSWEPDPTGTSNGATGLSIGMLDWMKIGQIYLGQGTAGSVEYLGKDWVSQSITRQLRVSNYMDMGYWWWRFSDNFQYFGSQPLVNDACFMPGMTGTQLYIIPHKNMMMAIGASNLEGNFFSSPSLYIYFEALKAMN
ncbi:MAG: beta-lactamase family protein [Cyclobacteriaceae bacterium]|nr:beta-lactamase family protein [Cyclobacteriaceae bacterium]